VTLADRFIRGVHWFVRSLSLDGDYDIMPSIPFKQFFPRVHVSSGWLSPDVLPHDPPLRRGLPA